MGVTKILKRLVWLAILVAAGFMLLVYGRQNPEDLPWTPLSLSEPVGLFTGRKMTILTSDTELCRNLLSDVGVSFEALPERAGGPQCRFQDGISLTQGEGSQRIGFTPSAAAISCPVAAALTVWEWEVIQPAAREMLGQAVVGIEHLGGYNCRRMNGASEGQWSEHATGDAIDISGFVLEDGRRITLIADWEGDGSDARFLRQIRDGACDLFSTVLSPDYNAAHADHFHLDQAERGAVGWRSCR